MRTLSLKHRRAVKGGLSLRHGVAGLTLVALGLLCVRAGLWQLERADTARTLSAAATTRSELPPVHIGDGEMGEQTLRYRRAIARGTYEPQGRVLLDGKKRAGRTGYHLVVPLRLAGSERRLLVNLGWVPGPPVSLAPAGHEVRGLLDRPRMPALRLGAGRQPNEVYPYLDLETLSRQRGYSLYPYILIADERLARATAAAGMGRGEKWGMHIGYAIQWFFFALLAVALLGLVVRHGRAKR